MPIFETNQIMTSTPKQYIEHLDEKLFDKIQKLASSEKTQDIRFYLKACLLEIIVCEHQRPAEGLPDNLEKLIDKVCNYSNTSQIDFNLYIETTKDEIILDHKEEILLLCQEIESYLKK